MIFNQTITNFKENSDFPLVKDYHSNIRSSPSLLIFFFSFCYTYNYYGQPFFYAKDATEVKG